MSRICMTLIVVGCVSLLSCRREGSCFICPPPTADTSSHAWTFTTTRLGDGNSSALYDVSILNDTLAYAVGEIYLKDSTGLFDPQPYALAVWDGKVWRLQRVPYYYQGQPLYHGIYSILAFGADDVWYGIGNLVHRVGGKFQPIQVGGAFSGIINKMWGTSSTSFYVAGNNGAMALYNGSIWQSVQTGTTLNFYDIYGSGSQVMAVACNPFAGDNRLIVNVAGLTVFAVSDTPISSELFGTWFAPNQKYYVVGDGIYEKNKIVDSEWSRDSVGNSLPTLRAVRGNNENDVFTVGLAGEVLHFNGRSWQSYRSQTGIQTGGFASVAVKGNLVIAVGEDSPYAMVAVGRR